MLINRILVAGVTAASLLATPLIAGDIMVKDAYARSSTPSSVTGAAFLTLMNHSDADDRLLAASSSVAKRVELHTHQEDANGVMKMVEVKEGFALPAGGMHTLKRGGDHIMFMGLTEPLVQGDKIAVTLTFETAGDVEITIPVDLERKPAHGGAGHSHTDHDHSNDS
ncbi:MAG: copper chaperone PCu(A)C [Pseudomonadota bacterium]